MSDEGYKVVGEQESEDGAGVYGHNTATSGDAIGVEGSTESGEGYGLYTEDDANIGGALESTSKSPSIVVYEDEAGTAKAVRETETHTGDDIFVAAQDAIDSQIEENLSDRNQYNRPLHHVKIDVVIKPGLYTVSTGLSITEPGSELISIRGTGKYGAYIRCTEFTGDRLIEIEPDPPIGTVANNRLWRVQLSNLAIDYRDDKNYDGATDSDRDCEGIYLNDITHCAIDDIEARGFSTALTVRNCWQGHCNNSWFSHNGSAEEGKPAIKVEGGGDDEDDESAENATANATNHWKFTHLQGGHGHTEYAYMEFDRKTQQIIISSPNLEMSKSNGEIPTFLFRNSDNLARSKLGRVIVHDAILGGNPTFKLNDTNLWVSNSEFYGPQLLDGTQGYNYVYLSNIKSALQDGSNGIEMSNGLFVANNLAMRGGARAIRLEYPQYCQISNSNFVGTQYETIKLVQGGGGDYQVRQINNCAIRRAGTTNGVGISIEDCDNSCIDNVAVSLHEDSSSSAAIQVDGSSNVSIGTVLPIHNVSRTLTTNNDPEFRESSGAATVDPGTASVSVDHNLVETPEIGDITVTPASPLGSASSYHIRNLQRETFEIALDTDPGQAVEFAWTAEL